MALIHERFYQTDGLSKIDFDDYINKLSDNLFRSFKVNKERVGLEIHAERISLDIDTAVPCGLIINEIVSNSLKHAFNDGSSGKISIELIQVNEEKYRLTISDDGLGFSDDFNLETSDSMGIQLIQALTDQLEGTMELITSPAKGVKYIIEFRRITQ